MKHLHLLRSILAAASFLAIAVPANMGEAQAQSYETFRVNGEMALNTNNNFRLIDGQPRMAIWLHNISDVDQQFQRLAQTDGSFLLRQRSTGKCLNAHRLWNGAEINVWPCSSSDPDQRFRLNHLGNGVWQIQRSGTNLCVDSPTRSNAGIVHLWDCLSSNPNQRWQSSLTPPPPPPPSGSYRTTIEQVLNSFFSRTSNTNGQAWNSRSILDKWDRIGGESAQFPGGLYTSGDLWQVDMPAEVNNVYRDLSTAMFGSVMTVTTGYAYDKGYYDVYGAHSAIDIGAANGTSVKSPINGRVVDNRAHYHNGAFNGYWVAIDELDASGQRTGRRWWFGHLRTNTMSVGSRVTAGQTVLGQVGQGHLHLGVVSSYQTYTTSMYGNEVRNGPKSLGYSGAVQDVLNRTMSPLQAYWRFRNNIRQ